MGYTHYWRRIYSLPQEEYVRLGADIREMANLEAEKFDTPIKMVATSRHILLTGPGEPFDLPRVYDGRSPMRDNMFFSFCKTRQSAYDTLVVGALFAAKYHLGDAITCESDGGRDELTPGLTLFERVRQERGRDPWPGEPFELAFPELVKREEERV